MRIRAENDPRYSYKFLIMGIGALGFALYCLYDGFIGYPRIRERGFAEFKDEMAKSPTRSRFSDPSRQAMTLAEFEVVADADELQEWNSYSHDRGIKSGPDVFMQFVMAAGTALIGAALLWGPLRSRGRWIEASDDGINSSWGDSFRFDEVEVVNKRAWRKKGIAKITYVSAGRRRAFVVDDFKYQRWATDAILYELEQRIDQGRITNGPPEPEPEGKVAEVLAVSRGGEPAAST
jgi:hypothetical protein